jgi:glycerate-2-kinase
LIEKRVHVKGNELLIETERKKGKFQLNKFDNIRIIGWGKASGLMAESIEKTVPITDGIVNIVKGTKFKVTKIKLQEAEHPIPGEGSFQGTKKILEYAEKINENDLVICLISGGGSALLSQPIDGVTLEEKQILIDMLLKRGANINELNAVRKHISKVKGGRFAKELYPATIINFIISDVVGDPLDVISSGPTVPDSSTFLDAKQVLLKYGLWNSSNACKIIEKGINGLIEETPKENDSIFKKVHSFIIGSNETALLAAKEYFESFGVRPEIIRNVQGDAREAGRMFAGFLKKGKTFIAGGETTVKVTGSGLGGRNQEIAMSCALEIAGMENILFTSFGTDGIDGKSPADGAVVDGETIGRGEKLGLNAFEFQRNNDTYNFFKKINSAIMTGPTRTNVNDVMIGIAGVSKSKSP